MKFWDWPADADVAETQAAARMILADVQAHRALHWTARTASVAFAGVFDLSGLEEGVPDLGFMVPRSGALAWAWKGRAPWLRRLGGTASRP